MYSNPATNSNFFDHKLKWPNSLQFLRAQDMGLRFLILSKSKVDKAAFITFKLSPIILSLSIRHAPALSLTWTFLYLLFFRLATWFGLPQPTPFSNAIQLLLTLKVQKHKITQLIIMRKSIKATEFLYNVFTFVVRWWVWPTRCTVSTRRRKRMWAPSQSLLSLVVCLRSRLSTILYPIATVMSV